MGKYIITGTTTTIADSCEAILITVNAALTGTITVTVGGATQAIITNPGVGAAFRYGNLTGQGTVAVVTSTTCDITVSRIAALR